MAQAYKFDSIRPYVPRLAFSYSSLSDFDPALGGCPRKFWFAKHPSTKSLGRESGEHLALGRAFHDFAAEYQALRATQQRDNEWVTRKVEEHGKAAKLSETARDDLAFMCRRFVAKEPFEAGAQALVEQKLALDVDLQPCEYFDKVRRVFWRANVDRYSFPADATDEAGAPKTVEITDWKTGRTKDPDEVQLLAYAWTLKRYYPTLTTFRVGLYFVRDDHWIRREFGVEDLARAESWVKGMAQAIDETTTFEPAPSKLCDWCGWAHLCDAHRTLPIDTPAAKLLVLCQAKAFVKAIEDELKGLLKAGGGRIEAGNAVAEMRRGNPTRTIDVEGFRALIGAAYGIADEVEQWRTAAQYLKLDTSAKPVKALLKDPALAAFIDEVSTFKPGAVRFYVGKVDKALPLAEPTREIPGAKAAPAALPPASKNGSKKSGRRKRCRDCGELFAPARLSPSGRCQGCEPVVDVAPAQATEAPTPRDIGGNPKGDARDAERIAKDQAARSAADRATNKADYDAAKAQEKEATETKPTTPATTPKANLDHLRQVIGQHDEIAERNVRAFCLATYDCTLDEACQEIVDALVENVINDEINPEIHGG